MELLGSCVPCDDGFQFRGPSEGGCYNRTLAEMREEGALCDITIQAGSQSFQAHRAVLAAASPVFRAMFKRDFAESRKKEITLESIDSQTLENLIDFIYCNMLKITNANAIGLLETAMYLQMTPVIDACFEFLSCSINKDNVLAVLDYAQLANKTAIMKDAYHYILLNFKDVCKCDRFAELSVETLKSIICSDDLYVTSEEVVFKAVFRWVKALENDRKNFLPELLKHIRLPLLLPDDVEFLVFREPLIRTSPVCEGMLARLYKWQQSPSFNRSPVWHDFTTRPRLPEEKHHMKCLRLSGCGLYTFCTVGDSASLTRINYFDSINRKWASLCNNVCIDLRWLWHVVCTKENLYFIEMNNIIKLNLKTVDATNLKYNATVLSSTGIAYHSNRVYLFGGFGCMANKAYIFDLQNGIITEIGSLVVERRYSATAASENFIFIIGGEHPSKSRLRSVEKFSPETRQSTEVSPMLRSRTGCSCAVVEGKIYVCGGELQTDLEHGIGNWSVEVYDIQTNEWSIIREMNRARDVCLIPYEGKLLALHEDPNTKNLQCETYDPKTHEWKFDNPQFSDLFFFKAAVLTKSAIRFTDFDPSNTSGRHTSASNDDDFFMFENTDEDF